MEGEGFDLPNEAKKEEELINLLSKENKPALIAARKITAFTSEF